MSSVKQKIVIVGGGMVGKKFCEKLVDKDLLGDFEVEIFGEEPQVPYDRVQLTEYFKSSDENSLALAPRSWYTEHGITLHTSTRVAGIDRANKQVFVESGESVSYDKLILATGSNAFVPPIPGADRRGVHVYRTIADLQAIEGHTKSANSAVVIGGGLLGLEAARAVQEAGLEVHVVELADRLMARQLDKVGGDILADAIDALGVKIHVSASTKAIVEHEGALQLQLADGSAIEADMVILSVGISPRDDLAHSAELEVGPRGGIVVDPTMRTSDSDIFAIGECALYEGMIYGLVAPGYQMAEVAAEQIAGNEEAFTGSDMSTKLKLMGLDVATIGDSLASGEQYETVELKDRSAGIYKKLVYDPGSMALVGAILVGDAEEYGSLLSYYRSETALPSPTYQIIASGGAALPELANALICNCENVSRADIEEAVVGGACDMATLKSCTKAGNGCGGCGPELKRVLSAELARLGVTVSKDICEHFPYSRQELLTFAKVRRLKSFDEMLASVGTGAGCEVCKPLVASILACSWNDLIFDHATIQDTNDRYLANIQRGGTYSVVPRIPGGEITPDKLIVIGEVAKKYNLYTKLTGGQRVDLFGARLELLPQIWEELIEAGFESGHAYAKGMRTVKACVGTPWCRFGLQDSTSFAIRLEERYKGLRAPHKLKSAVSGCMRECAEARSKDFGIIATERGWSLYVCGNGGANPRHADILATDLGDDECVAMIDRFLMYYILTADPLTRTSSWLESLEGGLDTLRDVVINDSLGICDELEAEMDGLVGRYKCEWAEVVNDPQKRRKFQAFANSNVGDPTIEFVTQRGQKQPISGGAAVAAEQAGAK